MRHHLPLAVQFQLYLSTGPLTRSLLPSYSQCSTRSVEIFQYIKPASVAELDARPMEDQEVAGPTLAGSATFFCGD